MSFDLCVAISLRHSLPYGKKESIMMGTVKAVKRFQSLLLHFSPSLPHEIYESSLPCDFCLHPVGKSHRVLVLLPAHRGKVPYVANDGPGRQDRKIDITSRSSTQKD
jgi:hypothetical protein